MSGITQADRLLAVYTTLDFDVLLIESFVAHEEISRPFHFDLRLVADVTTGNQSKVKPQTLIGKAMAVQIQLPKLKTRYFTGLVKRFTKEAQDDRFAYYRAELVPWFSFLALTSDCRIFQDMTVPEIIAKIAEEAGYKANLRPNLQRTYTKWDYCVQYRESDFNFLSRLMEHEGISYYFEYIKDGDQARHVMVLIDTVANYQECPIESTFVFAPQAGTGETEDNIHSWEMQSQVVNGAWALRDWHFEMPKSSLEVTESSVVAVPETKALEIYDYPGDYTQQFNGPNSLEGSSDRLKEVRPEGQQIVRMRMQQEECHHLVGGGISHCRPFSAGYKFTVTGSGKDKVSGEYLLTSVQHTAVQHPAYYTRAEMGAGYRNSFTCVPSSTLFRPARLTPRPVAHGPQTAIVIEDAPGQEISCDKYGRVKVRFHWDRRAQNACWIRVAQAWAGRGWGFQWIPRVGDEVIVDFLEGDPDRPIIVGSVYNSANLPPFTLPDHKTQSGVKTRSSEKGGDQNFNLFRFEDLKGSENITLHAERNLTTEVEVNESRSVGHNRSTIIQNDETIVIKDGNRTETLEKGNETITLKTGNRQVVLEQGNDELTIKIGNYTTSVPAGTDKVSAMTIELDGTTGITLSCGASSIKMDPATITITAPLVKINS